MEPTQTALTSAVMAQVFTSFRVMFDLWSCSGSSKLTPRAGSPSRRLNLLVLWNGLQHRAPLPFTVARSSRHQVPGTFTFVPVIMSWPPETSMSQIVADAVSVK
jgi:hypothetical protein